MKLTDEGAKKILQILSGEIALPASWTLKLFKDNATLNDADTPASRTECTLTGYAAATLNRYNATPTTQTANAIHAVGGIYQLDWDEQTFTFTGNFGETVYGAELIDADGVLWAEQLLDTPKTPTQSGETVKVTVKLPLGNGTPA